MKKNLYGNIEDIVQNIKLVTSVVRDFRIVKLFREPTARTVNGLESQAALTLTTLSLVLRETSASSLRLCFVLEIFQK